MPKILVVEQEKRYVERISEALSSQGWEVQGVRDRAAAVQHVADHAASLVVVNSEMPESAELIKLFSRRFGGPGTVVLVPENAPQGSDGLGADEVLQKPFSDQDIRLAVRRCLSESAEATSSPGKSANGQGPPVSEAVPGSDSPLTSEDIFGDVVSELETALSLGTLGSSATKSTEPEPEAESMEPEPEAESMEPEPEAAASREDSETAVEGPAVEAPSEREAAEAGREEPVGPEKAKVAPSDEPSSAGTEIAAESEAAEAAVREPAASESVAVPEVGAEESAPEETEERPEDGKEEVSAEGVADDEKEAPVGEVETGEAGSEERQPDATAAEEEARRLDPAAILDARIRQAAEEGTRLAATQRASRPERQSAADDLSPDDLLHRILGSGAQRPAGPDPRRRSEETSREVDALLASIPGSKAQRPAAGPPADEAGSGEADNAVPAQDSATEDPAMGGDPAEGELEVIAEEAHAEDERDEAAESANRLKLIGAILIVAVLVALGFILARRAGGEASGVAAPAEAATPAASALGDGATGAPAAGAGASAADGAESGEREGTGEEGGALPEAEDADVVGALRRELAPQRRQLQQEIAEGRSPEEDGDGTS